MSIYNINQTGSETDVNLFMVTLNNFISVNTDFTIIEFSDKQTGKRLVLQRSGVYYVLQSFIKIRPNSYNATYDGIEMFMTDNFDPLLDFEGNKDNCPFYSSNCVHPFFDDIPFYGIYWNGDNLILVAEYNNGFYSMSNIGDINPMGNYTVSALATNLYTQTNSIENYYGPFYQTRSFQMYCSANGGTWHNAGANDDNYSRSFNGPMYFHDQYILENSYNSLSNASHVFYDLITLYQDNGYYKPIATIEGLGYASYEFCDPQQVFSVGNKQFIFFPFYQKEVPPAYGNDISFGMGIAIRIV